MELEELIKLMEFKTRNDIPDSVLTSKGQSNRENIGITEYSYGITSVPCAWVYPYLRELEDKRIKLEAIENILNKNLIRRTNNENKED